MAIKTMKPIKFILIIIFLAYPNCQLVMAQTLQKTDSLIIQAHSGMSVEEFNQLLQTDKYVLADFYADWCVPCKKLTPVIEEIAKEMKDKVVVIRINQDNNKPLFDALKVYELPTLLIYKNKTILWTGEGVFPREMIEAEFK